MANQDLTNSFREINKTELLSLDIATRTGYFSIHGSGTWNFNETKKRNNNKQHKAFYETISSFIKDNGVKLIVAEDINVNNYFTDIKKLSQFHGLLYLICDELSLPDPYYVNVATLKKWATGNGRASKQEMMQACTDKYGFIPPDDNVSDACHLYHYFIRKYRIF
ncbi:hypothetical protein IR083_07235 [Dysgonomonas sp. GY75]|uniref:hypothetical protein n=1 Tax=Dysgonomonas sp. GY75 TaxID=2780419 RepID=UPI0018844DED|nr:hypothetical protein [Dysgonomonas sp. GY75]MBF0648608.1 hypothetical protein [Dysgonomonas sp. GY75]